MITLDQCWWNIIQHFDCPALWQILKLKFEWTEFSAADNVALGDVSLQYFRFPLSVSFHQCSILIFIYTISYRKDKRATHGKLEKKTMYFGNRLELDINSLPFGLSSKVAKSLPCQKELPLPSAKACVDKSALYCRWTTYWGCSALVTCPMHWSETMAQTGRRHCRTWRHKQSNFCQGTKRATC